MVRNDRSDARLETEAGKEFFHVMLDKINHPDGPHKATEEEMYQLRAIIYRYIHATEIACDTLGVFKALCGDAHLFVHFCEVGQDEEFKERQPLISVLSKGLHQNGAPNQNAEMHQEKEMHQDGDAHRDEDVHRAGEVHHDEETNPDITTLKKLTGIP